MRPLRIKASGTPITSSNFTGLQEMTDGEIQQYLSYVLTNKFATDTDGTGTGELNVDGASGTSIGTFTNTIRQDSIGSHPTAGATSSNTYTFKQVTSAASESITARPAGYDSGVKQMSDSAIDTDILDKALSDMVSESDYTVGQYVLQPSAPTGGTWTSRYTITDTAQGGNNNTYLWQKTAPTSSANSDLASVKTDGSSITQMTAAEIEQMVPNFRNRIIDTGVGTYKVQATAPTSGGTWVQMGSQFDDTRQEVASENYVGAYTGNYSGSYVGAYVGAKTYSGNYSGSYAGNYVGGYVGSKTYSGNYSGNYSGSYQGNYVGTSGYSGSYSGSYQGNYVLYYSGYAHATYTGYYSGTYTGYYTGPKTYTGYYTGTYTGYFTGNYVGTSTYSGTYTGYYSGTYTGHYVGTSAYSGSYTGTYTGYYSGTYAGDTIQATTETVSSIKLWIRTA